MWAHNLIRNEGVTQVERPEEVARRRLEVAEDGGAGRRSLR